MVRVGTPQRRIPIFVHGTDHVVIGQQVVKAQVFGGPADPPHSVGISTRLCLWVHNSQLHAALSHWPLC